MRYGVSLSAPDLGNDAGFLKDVAQTVEGAGFDHILSAEHVVEARALHGLGELLEETGIVAEVRVAEGDAVAHGATRRRR